MNIYFDKSLKGQFLASQKLAVNENGYLIDQNTNEVIRDDSEKLVKSRSFAGIRKGSRVFLAADIATVLREASLEAKQS